MSSLVATLGRLCVLVMVLNAQVNDSFVRAPQKSSSRTYVGQLQGMLYTGKGPAQPPRPSKPEKDHEGGDEGDKGAEATTPDILKIDLSRDDKGQISEGEYLIYLQEPEMPFL